MLNDPGRSWSHSQQVKQNNNNEGGVKKYILTNHREATFDRSAHQQSNQPNNNRMKWFAETRNDIKLNTHNIVWSCIDFYWKRPMRRKRKEQRRKAAAAAVAAKAIVLNNSKKYFCHTNGFARNGFAVVTQKYQCSHNQTISQRTYDWCRFVCDIEQ